VSQRVFVINENGVVTYHLSPAADTWIHAIKGSDFYRCLNLCFVDRADQTFESINVAPFRRAEPSGPRYRYHRENDQ
jgi:hypothetical protein